jgi:head-tail adaptor
MARAAARRRTKLMFQYDSRTKDTDGFETANWTDKGERMCSVEPLQGREYWSAHAVLGSQPLRITAHYDEIIADVEPDRWRMKNDTTVYSIRSMVNVGMQNRKLEFTCTTGTGVLD